MFGLIPWRKENRNELATPSNPFDMIRREFDSLFDRFFGGWSGLSEPGWESAGAGWGLTLDDTGNEVVVRAEAPGFSAGEFDVQLSGDQLSIVAEHREEGEGKDTPKRWARYARSLTLPVGVDPTRVEARYVNGVLEIHVPKTPEAQPRRIEVKA